MRLLTIVLLASIPGAGFAAAPRPARDMPIIDPDASARINCPPISRYGASRRGGKPALRHLDELPGADLYLAVDRHVGNCNAPIIVRYDIGGKSKEGSSRR